MSGQLLPRAAQGGQAQAHPCGHHVHPGRSAAIRRSAHVRGAVRREPRRAGQRGARARRAGVRPRRRCRSVDRRSASCSSPSACEAQGVPHRPDDRGRASATSTATRSSSPPACATTARRLALAPRRCAGSTGRWSRCCTRPSSTAGSTLADEQYVDLYGKPGEFQEQHKVYDREGQPCRRCRSHRSSGPSASGRSTFYCPQCQV